VLEGRVIECICGADFCIDRMIKSLNERHATGQGILAEVRLVTTEESSIGSADASYFERRAGTWDAIGRSIFLHKIQKSMKKRKANRET